MPLKIRIREMVVALSNVASGLGALLACLLFQDTLSMNPRLGRFGGFVAIYGGIALVAWAARHLGSGITGLILPSRDRLVTTGPYRWVRHPVYVGITSAMIGVALATQSTEGLLAVLLLFLPSELYRARQEERALAAVFGPAWDEYRARTPPRSAAQLRAMRTNPPVGETTDPDTPSRAEHEDTRKRVARRFTSSSTYRTEQQELLEK